MSSTFGTILTLGLVISGCVAIYPFYDTQDFIYNIPKVYRISITLDKLLAYYERKPSKDPEFYVALQTSRHQLQFTIDEMDKSVPDKLRENLNNLTRIMDRIIERTNKDTLVYRSKDYRYVMQSIIQNMDSIAGVMEPITVGSLGAQKPYQFTFEDYVKEALVKMPIRKVADSCMMQILINSMETQTSNDTEATCEVSSDCASQLLRGSGLGFQQTARLRALSLMQTFECGPGVDLTSKIYAACMHAYKEAVSLESWNHPPGTYTLFMQQILYCSLHGYAEFVKPRWMNKILAWQEPRGCYADERLGFEKITGYISSAPKSSDEARDDDYRFKKVAGSVGASCNSLTSAMALGSLTMYVRALLETDPNFHYDIMK